MQIMLYKMISDELLKNVGYQVGDKILSYENIADEADQLIDAPQHDSQLIINEVDPNWSPIEHNLKVEQEFNLSSPDKLFGDEGVTNRENTLGLACHIYSKTSNFQTTVHVGDIINTTQEMTIPFQYEFEPNSIGGTIYFDFYIYLKEIRVEEDSTANSIGTNLMDEPLEQYVIIVDGSGSEFPIEEINDPTQPLWRVEMNWTDIYEDLFNSNAVRIILNQAHELFGQLMNQRNRINQYLMSDIIMSSMAMVIQEAIIADKNELNEDIEYQPGSIAQVIWYWISTYEVNTESIETISNSLRKNADLFIKETNE